MNESLNSRSPEVLGPRPIVPLLDGWTGHRFLRDDPASAKRLRDEGDCVRRAEPSEPSNHRDAGFDSAGRTHRCEQEPAPGEFRPEIGPLRLTDLPSLEDPILG